MALVAEVVTIHAALRRLHPKGALPWLELLARSHLRPRREVSRVFVCEELEERVGLSASLATLRTILYLAPGRKRGPGGRILPPVAADCAERLKRSALRDLG